jgi:A/G-specific adenine glycosylase
VLSDKKPPVARRVQAVVATRASDGAIQLARRRADRLFGGLWEPPSIEGPARLRAKLVAWLPVGKLTRAGGIEHILSHRRLSIDVFRAELTGALEANDVPADAGYDDVRIVDLAAIERLGFSTLARKVLAAAATAKAARQT